jgi:hypothetical protein
MAIPFVDKADLEEPEEVVGVSGSNATGDSPLGLDNVAGAVGVEGAELFVVSKPAMKKRWAGS